MFKSVRIILLPGQLLL